MYVYTGMNMYVYTGMYMFVRLCIHICTHPKKKRREIMVSARLMKMCVVSHPGSKNVILGRLFFWWTIFSNSNDRYVSETDP